MAEDVLEKLKALIADRYDVQKELGRGGMATVYLALDIKHDRKVAIKVLHPDLAASVGGDRFEREIRVAAKLQHPNILGMFDSGTTGGLLYYVMPFVEGESLRDKLDREGQLTLDDAIQFTLEVADALGFAHKQNIIHRDIKPENIMLSNGHALVADFGIARAVEESGAAKLTQTGMAVGTPVYMAPEQAGAEKIGPTADIYSLACMLYEMLAGEPPFTGKTGAQIMAKHAMEMPPSIRVVRPSVPEEVEEAIFAALGKTPADRPQTAAAFCEILGTPLGATATRRAMGRTATRRTPTGATRAYPSFEVVPLWRRPAVLVTTILVLVGGGFAAYWFGFRKPATTLAVGGLDPARIAVLYFDDVSKTKQLGYVADGLTEGLIQSLGQVQGLSVISRSGVEQFRGSDVPPDSIARFLQTGILVRGTVEDAGDKLRVGVRLIDGNSGTDLGQRASFERSSTDLIGVRDSLAQQVAALIRSVVGTEVRLREQRSNTRSAEAWALVQRAEQLRKRGEAAAAQSDTLGRRRDFTAADSLLAAAEKLDDKWAEPSVLRGLVSYRWSRLAGSDPTLIQKNVSDGLEHVGRALAMDPGNANGLELRGNLRYWSWLSRLEGDPVRAKALLDSARADLEAATRANPNQAGAYASLSHLYNQTGSATDVILAAREALRADAFLDNANVILSRLFLAAYDSEDFQVAGTTCQDIRRRFPAEMWAPRCELFMLTTRAREPDVGRAWALADSVEALAPGNRREFFTLTARMLVAGVLARTPNLADSARAVVGRSLGTAEMNPTRDLSLFAAFVYGQVGDKSKAIDQLKVYFAANQHLRAGYAENPGWWVRSLQDDPDFKRLVGTPVQ